VKSRILIVDDDVDLLELLRGPLENLGYIVRTVTTGEAALGQANTFSPDLIILDLMLPQMNGFAVCEQLRSRPTTATTPIIMMTALTGEFPRMEGMHSGCSAYISKPFHLRELLVQVADLLARPAAPPRISAAPAKSTTQIRPRRSS
jgi:two-component system phosphate regulon response regulator PhoB